MRVRAHSDALKQAVMAAGGQEFLRTLGLRWGGP
jgi:hypothetical protein